jgi:hypothetical protein
MSREFENIKLYRMTHIENIKHILEYGITHKNSSNANPNYVNIGDISLIENRASKSVKIDNGIYTATNTSTIILGDFIPFYFGVKMPMLYIVQNGGNFVESPTKPEDVIYLACSLKDIISNIKPYYFSDGHGTDRLTSFYDETKINDILQIIDYKSIVSAYLGGNENLSLKRKKQAEFLISNDIPPKFIIGFGCFNEK